MSYLTTNCHITITKTNQLILFKGIITVYLKKNNKHTNLHVVRYNTENLNFKLSLCVRVVSSKFQRSDQGFSYMSIENGFSICSDSYYSLVKNVL